MVAGTGDMINPDIPDETGIEGIVANTPSSVYGDVFVFVEGWDDNETPIGPCDWRPNIDVDDSQVLRQRFPNEGDRCVITVSDTGTPTIVYWTGDGLAGNGPAEGSLLATGDVKAVVGGVPAGWLEMTGQAVTGTYPELRQYLLDAGSPHGTSSGDPLLPDTSAETLTFVVKT